MSYDIWLTLDKGGDEPHTLAELDWNYTSNVAAMWRKAMPETDGLAGLAGMRAPEAAAIVRAGIARMEAEPDEYRALNPANGWGSFETQLQALAKLAFACEVVHPDAKVAIWR